VFRNYTATWDDADWWRNHHTRIVFACGGWYYWHANYWFPAWGYNSEAAYVYDGPIYAFNNLEPDQVGPDKKLTAFIEFESGDPSLTRERSGHIALRRNRAAIESSS